MNKLSLCILAGLVMGSTVVGCFEGPDSCSENVARVVSIDYSGPDLLPASEAGAGYSVTVTIERTDPEKIATVCYLVRDDDPWTKLFWAVDDVLADGFVTLPPGQDTWTVEGNFTLYSHTKQYGRSGEVCGDGWNNNHDGCSGESEAEIYLQVVDPSGPTSPQSPTRTIRTP